MRVMNNEEMKNANGGEFLTIMGIWAGICALWYWAMASMGDWALGEVSKGKKKKR